MFCYIILINKHKKLNTTARQLHTYIHTWAVILNSSREVLYESGIILHCLSCDWGFAKVRVVLKILHFAFLASLTYMSSFLVCVCSFLRYMWIPVCDVISCTVAWKIVELLNCWMMKRHTEGLLPRWNEWLKSYSSFF